MRIVSTWSEVPQRVGHDHDVAEHRPSETKKPSLADGVLDVRAIHSVRVTEYRGGLLECNAVLRSIRRSLLDVPLEHTVQYIQKLRLFQVRY